jgi:uncharacterized protein (DUF1800 family)
MALLWHDWFATSDDDVGSPRMMIEQNELFRQGGLGSFHDLLRGVTINPAMLVWLDGIQNRRRAPNENYAREMMELFTLGADRGAYTKTDVREMARALTGWRASWVDDVGWTDFRFDPNRYDTGSKTVFAKTGAWTWEDACRLCVEHPLHPSYLVTKLWSYFIAGAPSPSDREQLEALYTGGGYAIRPVVEAILMHPQLYRGARMVKPPVVLIAGLLRAQKRGIDTDSWVWLGELTGQRLFRPPNVSGWDETRWLDTSTVRARWLMVARALDERVLEEDRVENYDPDETPAKALQRALAYWGNPSLSKGTHNALIRFSAGCTSGSIEEWDQGPRRALRQNALRQLIYVSPDLQTC